MLSLGRLSRGRGVDARCRQGTAGAGLAAGPGVQLGGLEVYGSANVAPPRELSCTLKVRRRFCCILQAGSDSHRPLLPSSNPLPLRYSFPFDTPLLELPTALKHHIPRSEQTQRACESPLRYLSSAERRPGTAGPTRQTNVPRVTRCFPAMSPSSPHIPARSCARYARYRTLLEI